LKSLLLSTLVQEAFFPFFSANSQTFSNIFFVYEQAIAPYIPRDKVKLSSAIYEMVLYDFLKTDYQVMLVEYTGANNLSMKYNS